VPQPDQLPFTPSDEANRLLAAEAHLPFIAFRYLWPAASSIADVARYEDLAVLREQKRQLKAARKS